MRNTYFIFYFYKTKIALSSSKNDYEQAVDFNKGYEKYIYFILYLIFLWSYVQKQEKKKQEDIRSESTEYCKDNKRM